MDKSQELEWLEAQKIVISEDLIVAAKQQLRFLEEVDRNRCLYESPILDRAIHRSVVGKILEHDDTDSDISKGKKLNVGFSETSQQYETFGIRYWKAGAMYRNQAPSPVATTPCSTKHVTKNVSQQNKYQKYIQLPQKMVVDVLLEIVGIRNKPDGQKGNFFVTFSTKKPDMFLEGGNRLSILSESGHKRVSSFQCEPTSELVLTLMWNPPSNLHISRPEKTIGKTSISLTDLMDPNASLSIEKWCELESIAKHVDSKPIHLHIAVSFTVPRKVIGVTRWSEEAHILAVPTEDGWSLQDEHIFELRGPRSVMTPTKDGFRSTPRPDFHEGKKEPFNA
ncbi:hypothetical protein QJS04_geneDACA002157 [Acorus gramineus]|uniref:GRDP C2 domain-containing protein n=1 Tax=Acorus gramineus TaxID=55184 RepID=A0AAV9A9Q8_ACOGR|nr:hypothetical protein QJS04_geneDACA002157 [Acorus gramineus]